MEAGSNLLMSLQNLEEGIRTWNYGKKRKEGDGEKM